MRTPVTIPVFVSTAAISGLDELQRTVGSHASAGVATAFSDILSLGLISVFSAMISIDAGNTSGTVSSGESLFHSCTPISGLPLIGFPKKSFSASPTAAKTAGSFTSAPALIAGDSSRSLYASNLLKSRWALLVFASAIISSGLLPGPPNSGLTKRLSATSALPKEPFKRLCG